MEMMACFLFVSLHGNRDVFKRPDRVMFVIAWYSGTSYSILSGVTVHKNTSTDLIWGTATLTMLLTLGQHRAKQSQSRCSPSHSHTNRIDGRWPLL